jgi:ubiquinone/menaquinone biosynthesis C-methylase UbiE
VIAVEPLPEMRALLERISPEVEAVAGTAEQLPLADGSADAVTVGQAFHWFDAPTALAEIARVLLPGGVLGLVWNLRDERVPWVADLTAALRGAADVLTESRNIAGRPFTDERYTAASRREFPNPVPFDRARLRAWASSTSRIAVLPEAERERALDTVVRLAEEHPELAGRETFDMPFVAVVVRATRR